MQRALALAAKHGGIGSSIKTCARHHQRQHRIGIMAKEKTGGAAAKDQIMLVRKRRRDATGRKAKTGG